MKANEQNKFEKITDLAARRGFFNPAAEIYGGPSGFWDYGPLGATLKRNIVDAWRKNIVQKDDMLEIDGAQLLPPAVFEASGHLASFKDPLTECKKCKSIYRADKLIEEKTKLIIPEAMPPKQFDTMIKKHKINCPNCKGKLAPVRMFGLMISAKIGPKGDETVYLRPEACQSIFLDFTRVFRTMRAKLPIGLAQVGKAFRNEISPRQAIFRTRELTQADVEIFFNPAEEKTFKKFNEVKNYKLRFAFEGKEDKIVEVTCLEAVKKSYIESPLVAYYMALLQQLFESFGIDKKNVRFRELGNEEKAFYAKSAWDFEVQTSLGWTEVVANHYRSDHDLKLHSAGSGQDLSILDGDVKVLPWIWEDSMGVDRALLAVFDNAYFEEEVKGEKRIVLRLDKKLAPIQAAVFPLVNKDGIPARAEKVYEALKKQFSVFYDDSGSIGKRYRRMDEIGTPYCITIDHRTLEDDTVTVRDRDTMKQERVKIGELASHLF